MYVGTFPRLPTYVVESGARAYQPIDGELITPSSIISESDDACYYKYRTLRIPDKGKFRGCNQITISIQTIPLSIGLLDFVRL